MKHNICLALFALLFSTFAQAQSSITVLDQKIKAKVSGVTKSYQLQQANEPVNQFEFTIQNGDGLNYFPQICSGSFVQKILCKAQNIVKAVHVKLDRPDQLEVKINNQLIANRSNFPQEQGQLIVTRMLADSQNLTVFVKGLPTSDVTIKVKKFSSTPNQLPIARFDFTTLNDIEPSLVSFSAMLSSDSDGSIVSYNWNFGDSNSATGAVVSHTYQAAGSYNVSLTVTDDRGGQNTLTQNLIIRADTSGPTLSNIQPANNSAINGNSLTISGESDENLSKVEIKVNNEAVQLAQLDSSQKYFSLPLTFTSRGAQNILITAYDLKNNQSQVTKNYNVSFNNEPTAKIIILSQSSETVPSMIWFSAEQSTDPDIDQLTYQWDFSDVETSTEEKPTHLFKEAGSYTVTLTVSDGFGGSSEVSRTITLQSPILPNDPAENAPALSEEVPQSNAEQLAFLVEGENAVQKDAVLESFDQDRATAINGKVLKNSTEGLEAVKVTIKDHPEYGYTLTRENGQWDLLVNGGGELIVQYEKDGFLDSSRIVSTENQAANSIQDVILVEIDSKKTVVSLGDQEPQVHEANVVVDSDGTRRTQVVIPANTTAQVVLPNGSVQTVDQLTIRATELSVGADGVKKLPAELPSRTGYTYAADFSADEAVALGAESIEFSKPVPMYVDNFLNVPVGKAVPVGYLNPKTGYWEPNDDGVVLKVLSIIDEKAQIDFKGQGEVATAAQLASLQIDEAELKIMAQKFQVGQTFWRAQSRHFSTFHWGFIVNSPPLDNFPKSEPEFAESDGVIRDGPVINVQRQMLEESIPMDGLDFDLDYTNEKSPGRKTASTVEFAPVNENVVTPSPTALLSYFKVTVTVAGQKYEKDYSGSVPSDTVFQYAWDGKDSFGRAIPDAKEATVSTDYRYPTNYESWDYEAGTQSFDTRKPGLTAVAIPARGEISLTYSHKIKLSSPFDRARVAPAKQFGGWMPSVLKSYDPVTKTLYGSTSTGMSSSPGSAGGTVQARSAMKVITTIAGNGQASSLGDGAPASAASLFLPTSVSKDAAGNIYICEEAGRRIRKITKDGVITTIAGNGGSGYTGDGGLAINAQIGTPLGALITENGTIYFNDNLNNVTRKIDPNGIISTVAGNGTAGYSGDNGPGTSAQLNGPRAMARGKDGSIYITDTRNNVLRRLWPNGQITTFAGTGQSGFSGDDGPALEARFNQPNFTDIDEQGNIYIADTFNNRVRKISSAGIVTTIAGNGIPNGPSNDYEDAVDVSLNNPAVVKVNSSGEVYISERNGHRIRKIDREGTIVTVIGTGFPGFNGDGKNGTATQISGPRGFILDSDDSILFTDGGNHRVRRFSTSYPSSYGSFQIASVDGEEVYEFDSQGRHLKTLNGDTLAVVHTFNYSGNEVSSIADAYGRQTIFNRDSGGNLSSITGPDGQSFTFTKDATGSLNSIKDPLNNEYRMTNASNGLLTSVQKPEGGTTSFEYDNNGRLKRVNYSDGGFRVLTRSYDTSVEMRSSMGLTSTYLNKRNEFFGEDVLSIKRPDLGEITKLENLELSSGEIINPENAPIEYFKLPNGRYGGNSIGGQSYSRFYKDLGPNFSFGRITNKTYQGSQITSTVVEGNGYLRTTNYNTVTGNEVTTINQRVLTATRDPQGKPVRTQVGDLLPTFYTYDTAGRLTLTVQGNRQTSMAYDANGFLKEIIDAENRKTEFVNDALGRTLRTITPDEEQILVEYDKNSNLKSITPPQRLAYQFLTNTVDLLSSFATPGAAFAKRYSYDSDRRLRDIVNEGNNSLNLGYGVNQTAAADKITSQNTNGLNLSYAYHPSRKWLSNANSSHGINITYNRAADVTVNKDYSGLFSASVGYGYNPNGMQMISETVNGQTIPLVLTLDKLISQNGDVELIRKLTTGLIETKSMGMFTEAYTYNSFGEVTGRNIFTTNTPLYNENFIRDRLGRITRKDVDVPGFSNQITDYTYDLRGRLKYVDKQGSPRREYIYDAQGNRLSILEDAVPTFTATYDGRERPIEFIRNGILKTYFFSDDDNFIIKAEPVTNKSMELRYSLLNQLVSAKLKINNSVTKDITYLIDGEKKRVGKVVNETTVAYYVYDKYKRLIAELHPSGGIKCRFVYASQSHSPDYMIYSNGVETNIKMFFVKNHLGSILAVVDENGFTRQALDYDEFGLVLSDTNPGFQPFGFAGGHYDHDTGLVRFGVRDYDAEIGKWTQADPIGFDGGDTNLYAYVSNDPINKIDPDGKAAADIILFAVAGVTLYKAGMAIAEAIDCKNNPDACVEKETPNQIKEDAEKNERLNPGKCMPPPPEKRTPHPRPPVPGKRYKDEIV